MLLNGKVERVPIPDEPEEFMEFRVLRRKDLATAAAVQEERSFARMRQMGGEVLVALRPSPEEREAAQALNADPLAAYDLDTLLIAGIAAWSYATDEGKAIRVNADSIGELDQRTAEWAGRQILRLVGIMRPEEAEAARKNA